MNFVVVMLLRIFFFFQESTLAGRSSNNRRRSHHPSLSKLSVQQKSKQVLFDPTSVAGIRLTCLLLAISFIFVVCTSPVSIRRFLSDLLPKDQSATKWRMTGICFHLIMYLNHTVRKTNIKWEYLFDLLSDIYRSILFSIVSRVEHFEMNVERFCVVFGC